MIARFDHHPTLTALLALSSAVLVVVVITLATLLITAAPSGSVGDYPPVVVPSENYGDEWNNYGQDMDQPQPAKIEGNGADSAIDRHAEVVAAYQK